MGLFPPDFFPSFEKFLLTKSLTDFYQELKRLLAMSQEEATKESASTYRLWKWVQEFFAESGITPDNLEPAVLDSSAAQKGKIDETVKSEEQNIRNEDQRRRDAAYEASKPTLKQGAQAAAVGAAAEGGMAFCLGIVRKRKQGKRLAEFTQEDWQNVGIDTAKGTAQL